MSEMTDDQRQRLSRKIEILGEQINGLRGDLLEAGATFSAGIVRGAEESFLIASTLFKDPGVTRTEL